MTTAAWFLTLAALGQPGSPTPTNSDVVPVPDCIVSIIDRVQVPASSLGLLTALSPREGDEISRGQVLGKIDDRDAVVQKAAAQANHDSAEEQSKNTVRVRAAEAARDVAQAELDVALEINKKKPGTIPGNEVRRLELTLKQSDLQIDLAKSEQVIAGFTTMVRLAELQAADIEIGRRQITSPLNGMVVQLERRQGEWVRPGDTVLEIVRMDKLHVEGFVSAAKYAPVDLLGKPVEVLVHVTDARSEPVTGYITYCSPIVEANGDYRIRTEVTNLREGGHWLLRPGLTASMKINLRGAPATAAVQPAATEPGAETSVQP